MKFLNLVLFVFAFLFLSSYVSASFLSGFTDCNNINLLEPTGVVRTNEIILGNNTLNGTGMNLSGLVGKLASNADVRVVNASCNNAQSGVVLPLNITSSGANWVTAIFPVVNASTNANFNYSVYYGNTSTVSPSPGFLLYQGDFNGQGGLGDFNYSASCNSESIVSVPKLGNVLQVVSGVGSCIIANLNYTSGLTNVSMFYIANFSNSATAVVEAQARADYSATNINVAGNILAGTNQFGVRDDTNSQLTTFGYGTSQWNYSLNMIGNSIVSWGGSSPDGNGGGVSQSLTSTDASVTASGIFRFRVDSALTYWFRDIWVFTGNYTLPYYAQPVQLAQMGQQQINNQAPQMTVNSTNDTAALHWALFQSTWTSGTGLANSTFEFDNGNGTLYNSSIQSFLGASNTTSVLVQLNQSFGSVIRWGFFVNDSNAVMNFSGLNQFTTILSPPNYSNVFANNSRAGQATLFEASWNDVYGLANATFSLDNGSGVFVNYSNSTLSGTFNISNFTGLINSMPGSKIRYLFYVWNLEGAMNATSIYTINTTGPPQFYNVAVNTSDGGTDAAFTANITDYQGLYYYVFELDNGTGTLINYTNVSTNALSLTASFQSILASSGSLIRYQWFAVNNNSVMNATPLQSFTTRGYTLQAFDEVTGAPLVFNVTISNGTQATSLTNQSNGAVVIPNMPLGTDTFTFTATVGGYTARSYSQVVLGTGNVAQSAYLLASSQGQIVTYLVTGTTGAGITGAFINVQKLVGTNLVTVASGYTDSSGSLGFFLSPVTQYTLTFSASGYNTFTEQTVPSNTQYTIRLSASGQNQTVAGGSNVTFSFLPSGNVLNASNQTQQIVFTVNDPQSSLQSFSLALWYNGSQIFFQNVTGMPSGGFIMVTNLNNTDYSSRAGTNGILTAIGTVSGTSSGAGAYSFNVSTSWGFGLVNAYPGSLADALNQAASNSQLQLPMLIIALVAAIVIGTALTGGSIMGGFVGLAVIGVFMFAGIIRTSSGLIDWGVFVLGCLLVLALAFLRGVI